MDTPRASQFDFWAEGYQAITALHSQVAESGLERSLLELVRMRSSQLNGCAYCIDMHSKDALAGGESEQRLLALSAWRETTFFTERERASLAFAEAVTGIGDHASLDVASRSAAEHFSPDELTKLLFAVIEINAWNRLAITTGFPEPGSYAVPPTAAE